jgi:hypothetical protein
MYSVIGVILELCSSPSFKSYGSFSRLSLAVTVKLSNGEHLARNKIGGEHICLDGLLK